MDIGVTPDPNVSIVFGRVTADARTAAVAVGPA
jgi:hypothetical protein